MRKIINKDLMGFWLYRLVFYMCVSTVWTFASLTADTQFHLSGFVIGAMIAYGSLIMAFCMPFAGVLADRVDKRKLIILGGFISTLGMVVFAVLTIPWQYYLVSVMGVACPLLPCLLRRWLPVPRGTLSELFCPF